MLIDYVSYADAFEKMDIDPAFSHADHVGVAYEMLKRYDFLTACQKYSHIISTVAANAGASHKFNITITLAFLSVIAERMNKNAWQSANDFLINNNDLLSNNPLAAYYTTKRLASEEARIQFLLPDICPQEVK